MTAEQRIGTRSAHEFGVEDRALRFFEVMVQIRVFEERVRVLRLENEIQGSVHLCIGQEAIPVGACAALRSADPVYATYRGHGWAIASGAPLEALFAELLGRETGVNAGRGGSAYFSNAASSFMGENSIVGGGVPIAVGAALASRFQGSSRVAVATFGDGATNQGAVHEALNMAAAFKLPVVFVCENNIYSEMTPISEMVAEVELCERAKSYGMRAARVDGNDPEAVSELVAEACERARAGDGPTFIEALTYRLCGHYIGDPETYRTPEEVDEARPTEPLVKSRLRLESLGVPVDVVEATESAVEQLVDDACSAALESPLADTSRVKEQLYG